MCKPYQQNYLDIEQTSDADANYEASVNIIHSVMLNLRDMNSMVKVTGLVIF